MSRRYRYWVWAYGADLLGEQGLSQALEMYHEKWGRFPTEIWLPVMERRIGQDFEGIAIKYDPDVTPHHAQLWPVPNREGEWEDD